MHSKVLAKILAAAAGTTLAFASFTADAMPTGQIDGASAAPKIILAAEGCGPGFVRGPAGGCRRAFVRRPAVVVVPRRVVRPRCGIRVGPVGVRTPC